LQLKKPNKTREESRQSFIIRDKKILDRKRPRGSIEDRIDSRKKNVQKTTKMISDRRTRKKWFLPLLKGRNKRKYSTAKL
jgi:hypothetical protein